MMAGLLAGALGMAIYGLAPRGPVFWIGLPVMALWGLAGPASQGLMTRLVSPSEQGRLQGAGASLTSLSGLLGPGVFAATSSPIACRRCPARRGCWPPVVAFLVTRPRPPGVPQA